ncbi:hypothetical protein Mal52_40190 [Symmachiella dynata]|uniref:VOC domain-containing protein n=1 Tax=Symmachiella dynata TaxID=2527995 RepID=A0A517ZSX3_9PLAN|nr:glyoxalase [Symmachiella dynata]QDU45525.1 hypothetical protein Mal52_40190 [Symmachiella dynata]
MIVGLDHLQLAMPVDGEKAARHYYGELLSLKEIDKPQPLRSRGGVWFQIPDGRQLHLGVERDFRPSKKAHPCFVVGGDLKDLAQRLEEACYDVQFDDLNPPARRFYTHDVFGNRLEFTDRMSAE